MIYLGIVSHAEIQIFEHLKDFKALAENHSARTIKILRTDNGGEYVNMNVQHLYSEATIQLQHTLHNRT